MKSKIASLLGLCRKAGKLACGASAAETAIRQKKCFLVLIAEDAGESIMKKIINLSTLNGIEYKILFNKEWLGNAAGLDEKAVVAVKSKDFAEGILKLM